MGGRKARKEGYFGHFACLELTVKRNRVDKRATQVSEICFLASRVSLEKKRPKKKGSHTISEAT